MGSPDTSRKATEFDFDLGHEDGMNANATDSTYGDPTGVTKK